VIASEHRGPAGFRWILPGQLAGCAEPGVSAPLDYDLDLLRRVGVTWLLTLTETDLDQDALRAAKLRNLHVPVPDREAPTIRQAYMLARRIQQLLDQGEVLAVHCKAGIGRTGTALAAWMIREGGLTAAESIARLRRINPSYVQSEEQERFLKAFESDILQRM
jgi:atypical dual specificity phosphatase